MASISKQEGLTALQNMVDGPRRRESSPRPDRLRPNMASTSGGPPINGRRRSRSLVFQRTIQRQPQDALAPSSRGGGAILAVHDIIMPRSGRPLGSRLDKHLADDESLDREDGLDRAGDTVAQLPRA